MPVNPITGIVTYTLDEWKEESQLWERDGALRERERIIKLLEDRLQEANLPDGALFIESTVIKQLIKLIKEEK